MATINIEKLSLKELVALDQKLKIAISQARAREKAELKKKLAVLASEHGFSVSELVGVSGRGASKTKGIAKYANPDDPSDTWTGRGRKPRWVIARLKKGAKMSDFEI